MNCLGHQPSCHKGTTRERPSLSLNLHKSTTVSAVFSLFNLHKSTTVSAVFPLWNLHKSTTCQRFSLFLICTSLPLVSDFLSLKPTEAYHLVILSPSLSLWNLQKATTWWFSFLQLLVGWYPLSGTGCHRWATPVIMVLTTVWFLITSLLSV